MTGTRTPMTPAPTSRSTAGNGREPDHAQCLQSDAQRVAGHLDLRGDVFGLAVPVMIFNSDVPPSLAGGLGGAAALLALISAGMLRTSAGYLLGWLTQLVGLALESSRPR